ncbi:hypothetical protein ACROYT_G033591 [Oculina patagonica]
MQLFGERLSRTNSDVPVKDATGNVLSKDAEKLARWKEHFESILNRAEPAQVAEIPPAAEDLVICTDPPTLEEVKVAIKTMKNGKAGGADGVTAEMLKAEETVTPRILTDIFREIWKSERIPESKVTLYANFIDLEKAFDSIQRDSLWKILKHYGIPSKLVNVIKMLYDDCKSQVICNTVLTDTFNVTTGVTQGCILSPFLFVLGIDWIMKQVTSNRRGEIRWTLTSILEDLEYADDIVLLSHRYQDMQAKTNTLATTAGSLGLKISTKKTSHLRTNSKTSEAIMLNGEEVKEVEHFTYLGSMVSTSGNGEKEILARISKASQVFASLRSTCNWKSRNISLKTKIRFFKSNVLSTLLYDAESWKITKTISHKLDIFQNWCLRRILRIFWPNTISNYELRRITRRETITQQVQRRRWRWIGHVLRMMPKDLPRVAVRWSPDGRRKRGRPKETWRRTVEREMRDNEWTWGHLERVAADRSQWRFLVEALCAPMHEEE